MIIKVPITGTVIDFDIAKAKLDGIGISGDPNDPVRLIDINLGNVSMKLLSIDLENDEAEVEITPGDNTFEDTGQVYMTAKPSSHIAAGDPITRNKKATAQDKQRFLDEAEAKVKDKTKDQLYAETGSPKLKKLKKHVDDYKKYKAEEARR